MEPLSEQDAKYIKGFSWAAFFGTWVYLFLNKQNKWGWKILLLFILSQLLGYLPFIMEPSSVLVEISQFSSVLGYIYFGVCIWLGVRGREMVWNSKVYSSVEEFKQKQLKINKYINAYLMIIVLSFFVTMFILGNKLVENPELIDQKIEQLAFAKLHAENPNLNEQEFGQGYKKGLAEGRIESEPIFVADQTSSYQEGYRFGYGVACMEIHDNQNFCLKKFLDVPQSIK